MLYVIVATRVGNRGIPLTNKRANNPSPAMCPGLKKAINNDLHTFVKNILRSLNTLVFPTRPVLHFNCLPNRRMVCPKALLPNKI
jgi:hypothetical protein